MNQTSLTKEPHSPSSGRWLSLIKTLALAAFAVAAVWPAHTSTAPQKYQMEIPGGLPADLWQELVPKDNGMSAAKVALGEKLFFDKRLSVDLR
jgi:cytochrome c peroxidase